MTEFEDFLPKNPTLSDFQQLPIWKLGNRASVIIAWMLPHRTRVRLAGFFCDATLSDFEIREEAFMFYYEMKEELENMQE